MKPGTFTVGGKTYTPEMWRRDVVEQPWVRFFTVVVVVGFIVLAVLLVRGTP